MYTSFNQKRYTRDTLDIFFKKNRGTNSRMIDLFVYSAAAARNNFDFTIANWIRNFDFHYETVVFPIMSISNSQAWHSMRYVVSSTHEIFARRA